MANRVLQALGALVIVWAGPGTAVAASLDAYAGVVGGAGNGSIAQGCTTYGPPAELSSFFTFSGPAIPAGGIAPCGYAGGIDHAAGATGPITESKSLGPVLLGNPGFSGSYTGSANAVAAYGSLGASANGSFSGGLPGSPTALFEGAGAAKFADTLTASSPLVADLSAGFVRYQFDVSGSMTINGTPAPFYFGETYMALDLRHQNGPVFELMNAHARRGELATISNAAPGTGWTAGVGSLSGGSTLLTAPFEMRWGQPWDVQVGLIAWAYGEADASFLGTARLTGVQLFDANGVPISQFSLASASGTNYLQPVPEPAAVVLMACGLALTAMGMRRRARPLRERR